MRKLSEENKTLKQIVNDAGRPPARTEFHQCVSRNFLRKIQLITVVKLAPKLINFAGHDKFSKSLLILHIIRYVRNI